MPLVAFELNQELLDSLDAAVKTLDTDRSKFIRSALRAKLVVTGAIKPADADADAQPVVIAEVRE